VNFAARPGVDRTNDARNEPQHRPAYSTQGAVTPPLNPLATLGAQVDAERQRIRERFDGSTGARETLQALCALADSNIQQVLTELQSGRGVEAQGLCLLALGGYGRKLLFPYSDLDILFLFGSERAERDFRPLIAEFSKTLWDMGFRVSSAGRTVEECKRIEEDNAEFHLALLDRRFLAGDAELFERLDTKILPGPERQARPFLMAQLRKLTRERLTRYGNTIFHLEPNVKESPGGLRDYQAAAWMRQISGEKRETWSSTMAEEESTGSAVDFLSAIRCFLHYANGRNDNTLTYELQAKAAERALGLPRSAGKDAARSPAEWMRVYFRQARMLNRQLLRYVEQKAPAQQSLRQRLFNAAWAPKIESGGSKAFVVRDGLLEINDQTALADRTVLYALFAEAAKTGVPLSRETERTITYVMLHPELPARNAPLPWQAFQEILASDFPGVALRPMQRLGLLTDILPEFAVIDSLVVRDFYHRYTVDEHTLRTIEHLQELATPPDARGTNYAALWKTVERRDLLVLSLLLHDVGKGMPVENHVAGSLAALDNAAMRLQLTADEKAEVHFLIERHLDMSATVQRRDIFDPTTVSGFAGVVRTPERLQRLCLLTYADIHAVNPEALTPWKAEMLWQLFVATSNYFSRTLDRDRLHALDEVPLLQQIRKLTSAASMESIERFLEGFPRRYLAVHSAGDIASHYTLYQKLDADPVQTQLVATQHAFSLTLLTADRPALFATIAGVLAGWGMNIIKADAFGNAAGVVLDTFHFTDLHHTLELNPSEVERFRKSLADVVRGKAPLDALLKSREHASRQRAPKVEVATRISFDDTSSMHSTLLEIVTQDHPGLLHEIGSALARLGCNIEVALVDTEGQKAIDVFYLTAQGKRLSAQKQETLRELLQGTLG
jgi:[protein-PII] uridylyltransferase